MSGRRAYSYLQLHLHAVSAIHNNASTNDIHLDSNLHVIACNPVARGDPCIILQESGVEIDDDVD